MIHVRSWTSTQELVFFIQNHAREDEPAEVSDSSDDQCECIRLQDDDPDVVKIRQLKESGCGCRNSCHTMFEDSTILKHILDVREMDKSEKEMYIMAKLVDESADTKRGKKRKRLRHDFMFLGKKVCKNYSCCHST